MKKSNYHVTLTVNGETRESEGATVLDALTTLDLDYTRIKTKGEITVTKGEITHTRVIYLGKLRRIFANKLRMSGLTRDIEKIMV